MDLKPPALPNLIIPRRDLEVRLRERIELGNEIIGREIRTVDELKQARLDRDRWDEYNIELLKRALSTTGIADWYTQYLFQDCTLWDLEKDVDCFRGQVRDRINRLAGLDEKLALIPEFRLPTEVEEEVSGVGDDSGRRASQPQLAAGTDAGESIADRGETRVDRFLRWMKTHPIASVVYIIVTAIVVLGMVTGALTSIRGFVSSLSEGQADVAAPAGGSTSEQVDVTE